MANTTVVVVVFGETMLLTPKAAKNVNKTKTWIARTKRRSF